jgi:diguanylate cyclase (GGDEF)-like protein
MEPKQTVVIVDDDREIRTVIELALAKTGRTVVGFGDGQEALDFLERADGVDLVVSDVAMEGFDGHRLLRHLRASVRTAATPVIFVTAGDGAEQRIGAVDERGVDHLRKPFEIAELRALAESAMARRAAAGPPRDPETGLHTPAHFETLVSAVLSDAPKDAQPVVVMIGALDGTGSGAALRRVAEIIAMHLRTTDSAARLGERAFATLHPGCDAAGATIIAERILGAVSADATCAGATLRLGLAVAGSPRDTTSKALLAAADEALRAKRTTDNSRVSLRTV